ncbi:MAG TPA: DUF427 domain-containing protein [Terriglobales bacterium]
MRAIWNGKVLAESQRYESVEGNVYFPPQSVRREYLRESSTRTVCPWKGVAHYYSLEVDGKSNPDAAWYYPEPKAAASKIRDHVAFWRGVTIEK